MANDENSHFREINTLDGWHMAVSNKLSCTNEVIYAGLDCEWSTHDGMQAITRLLQI